MRHRGLSEAQLAGDRLADLGEDLVPAGRDAVEDRDHFDALVAGQFEIELLEVQTEAEEDDLPAELLLVGMRREAVV